MVQAVREIGEGVIDLPPLRPGMRIRVTRVVECVVDQNDDGYLLARYDDEKWGYLNPLLYDATAVEILEDPRRHHHFRWEEVKAKRREIDGRFEQ